MKVGVDKTEWYPILVVDPDDPSYAEWHVDIPEKLLDEYYRIRREFSELQEALWAIVDPVE